MHPSPVLTYLKDHGYGPVTDERSVAGGCISNAKIIITQEGTSFFLKHNQNTPRDMFTREAEGLAALRVDGGPSVPKAYLHGPDFILLEDLSPAAKNDTYWLDFGRLLAALHTNTNSNFGFEHDNYIGSTKQPNFWMQDGHSFFAEARLRFQAQMARDRGLLGTDDIFKVEKIVNQLENIIPDQPASLIHGDLWSGNAVTNSAGVPAIIDPAAHFGWAEAELAMTTLFGSFPTSFYQAYEEIRPLEPGYRSRFPIYNLYHLLNHLNIFGRSYLNQVQSVLRRYS